MSTPPPRVDRADGTSTAATSHGAVTRPLKAIGWAFLGIRGNDARQHDAARISPLVWIGTGIAAAVLFVLALMMVVRWVVPVTS